MCSISTACMVLNLGTYFWINDDLGPTEVSSEDVSDVSDGVTDNLNCKYSHDYICVVESRKG